MDPLTQALLNQQQLGQQQPQEQTPVVPPNPPSRIPQQVKRFNNAQAIQQSYRNGWYPNPVLLQATLGHK